jgi:GNAT superfamily N-acetyltransferase
MPLPSPDLQAICASIHARYRDPNSDHGVDTTWGRFGFYSLNNLDPSLDSILLGPLAADKVPCLIENLKDYFLGRPVRIYIDDRQRDQALRPALVNAGCRHTCDLLYLAHTTSPPLVKPVTDLSIEYLSLDNLHRDSLKDYAATATKAFADSEAEPDPAELEVYVASLEADIDTGHRYAIGRLGGQAVAVIGYYAGDHRLIFHLATRLPFRQRGIARHLLAHEIASSRTDGCGSITIFTDPSDGPVPFYRRMGFDAEVYWQARYVFEPVAIKPSLNAAS